MQNMWKAKYYFTFSASALVRALCPISSGTLTPAQPIHRASNSLTPTIGDTLEALGDEIDKSELQ